MSVSKALLKKLPKCGGMSVSVEFRALACSHSTQHLTMSGSDTLLKKLPSAVNMSVLVKLVVRPTAASAAKSPGESASCVTSEGKRHTCHSTRVQHCTATS